MRTGKNLRQIDKDHVWHPFTSLGEETEPIFISEAKGIYLHTSDGREIIDAISSWWVNLHGHSHPEIAAALATQASTLEHVIFAGFTHEPAINVARDLLTVLPSNQTKIFFSDNGSTAVEVGVKMALQYWYNRGTPRKKIIALKGAYHGDTFGSMSVGERGAFTKAFEPFLFDVDFIDVPTEDNIDIVLDEFRRIAHSGNVAAFIYEPLVQGAGGMIMYSADHLDMLLSEAKRNEIICIADEVFTGFGRTGKWFASDYLKHQPDIMAVSKGITGGTLPLGVTSCSQEIVNAFQSPDPLLTFFHGHSYTANPISCAAANASFKIMMREETWNRIRQIEDLHRGFITQIKEHPSVAQARVTGTIMAIELATPENTSYFNEIKRKIYSHFLSRDILLRPLGNIIYILPPYVIEPHELQTIYSAIESFLNEISSSKEPS